MPSISSPVYFWFPASSADDTKLLYQPCGLRQIDSLKGSSNGRQLTVKFQTDFILGTTGFLMVLWPQTGEFKHTHLYEFESAPQRPIRWIVNESIFRCLLQFGLRNIYDFCFICSRGEHSCEWTYRKSTQQSRIPWLQWQHYTNVSKLQCSAPPHSQHFDSISDVLNSLRE